MKLNQISSSDEATQVVVSEILEHTPVLRDAEFFEIEGDSSEARKPAAEDGGVYRAKDADYAEKTSAPDFENINLKIYGDQIKTDRATERRGKDIKSVHTRHMLSFARNMGKNFVDSLFNDDGTGNKIPGILTQMPAGQKITFGNNGTIVPLGNSDANVAAQQSFLEQLDALILSVRPQVLYANSKAISRLTAIARRNCTWVINDFGQPVMFYNGVRILDPGMNGAKADILSLTETVGTSNDCTSIVAVRWGEEADFCLATSNGLNVLEHATKDVSLHHTIEFDVDAVLVDDSAIGQIEGMRF
jgi:hypothetical protein